MTIHNIMEEIVYEVLDHHKERLNLACDCQQCLDDIMAIALNDLRPRYVAKSEKRPYARAPHLADRQGSTKVLATVTRAVEIVSKNPRCKDKQTT